MMPTCSAPSSVQQNSQFFLLCSYEHKHKAWLFANTPNGAQASSIFYSLIETAKANEIEPHSYLCHIFKALPYADTVDKLEALLPWNVKDQVAELKKTKG